MNYHHKLISLAFAIIFTTGLLSCSDSESKLKAIPGGKTAVIINLSLPPENPSAYDNSIWNRIRRLFVKDAIAQTAPATFNTISLDVTGADIDSIHLSYSPPLPSFITLEIPSGDARVFNVMATVDPADPSAALSFRGTATTNLIAGQTVDLPVTMALNETKILVPDPGAGMSIHNRFFQINDISGAGLTYVTGLSIGLSSGAFRPWDIDFDSRGRIYIATNGSSTDLNGVIRIDSINSTIYSLIANNSLNGVTALAIDRARNYVYFSPSNPTTATYGFRRCNLDGSGVTGVLPVTGVETIGTITGMDVDQTSGLLYMSGQNASASARIFQYNPSTQTVIKSYSANLASPEDVRVWGSSVYVANPAGTANFKIIQLDLNLNFVAGYGAQALSLPNTNPGQFYGPRHFVAIRNDSLIIMDDFSSPIDVDKLVSISSISGTGWSTYPATGDGQSLFSLYYAC